MMLVLTVRTTRFDELRAYWARSGTARPIPGRIVGTATKFEDYTGKLVFLDWCEKAIVKELPMPSPTGICLASGQLFVALERHGRIISIDLKAGTIRTIDHPFFNDLHSLERTPNGLIVASAGLDLVLEVSDFGESLFEWWATESGFDLTPLGKRRDIDKTASHQRVVYPTLAQTTHITSAIHRDRHTILASLFHQGMIVSIDIRSGHYKAVLKDVGHPHSLRRLSATHFLIAESSRNRALEVVEERDHRFRILHSYGENLRCDWVQDVASTTSGSLSLIDGNNTRILEVEYASGCLLDVWEYPANWRIFQILELPKQQQVAWSKLLTHIQTN